MLFVALAARATPAAAQACCTGGALVSPVRLAPPEDYAIGLQTRARNDMGAFQADGRFVSSSTESTEQDLEQDLAASFRLARRAQVGLVLPYVETHRTEPGVDDWGSGIGDLALNARYDFKLAAEMTYWPGFALLGGVVFPTGKAIGDGTNPAATDATGTGTTSASLGVDLEKVHGLLYGALNVWATYSASNTVTPPGATAALTTSYPLQLTALAVAGYVFENEAAHRALPQLPGTWRYQPQRRDPTWQRAAVDDRGRHRPASDRGGLAAVGICLQRPADLVVRAQRTGGCRGDSVAGPCLAVKPGGSGFAARGRSLMLPRRDRYSFAA